jgi:hypothetical protein
MHVILPKEDVTGKSYEGLIAFKRFIPYGEPSWTNQLRVIQITYLLECTFIVVQIQH